MYVIADAKRNDIGSTAGAYSKAFFDTLGSEALTVNGYLGYDGVEPFVRDGKMIFVLVKTSNPGSGQLQDLKLESGKTIYEQMGGYVEEWGAPSIGEYGYSNVGAVVGATHKAQLQELREKLPHTFFLIPGYGAQGGTAEDIAVGFKNGTGAIVNSSRGILCAYKKQNLPAEKFAEAARIEAIRMRDEINANIL
jgi:orotidine-5'-phosphate decarboxylase